MRKKKVLNLERDKEWKTRIKIIKTSKLEVDLKKE